MLPLGPLYIISEAVDIQLLSNPYPPPSIWQHRMSLYYLKVLLIITTSNKSWVDSVSEGVTYCTENAYLHRYQ